VARRNFDFMGMPLFLPLPAGLGPFLSGEARADEQKCQRGGLAVGAMPTVECMVGSIHWEVSILYPHFQIWI
jgi:hypothetical protein